MFGSKSVECILIWNTNANVISSLMDITRQSGLTAPSIVDLNGVAIVAAVMLISLPSKVEVAGSSEGAALSLWLNQADQ